MTTIDKDPDGDGAKFHYNLRFAGQYFDNETRLHYNYFRDYDPETGRYISSDPIGLAGGLNTYGYALQNPLSFVDPLGLLTFTFQGTARLPAFVSQIGQKLGILDVPITGFSIGIAESFPFFDGAERDSGTFFTTKIAGADFGIGKISTSIGIFKGSVCDLVGNDGLTSSVTAAGVNLELSKNNSGFTGIAAGVGAGFNIGHAVDGTIVFSQKHGLISP